MTLSGMICHCPDEGIQVSAGNRGKLWQLRSYARVEHPSAQRPALHQPSWRPPLHPLLSQPLLLSLLISFLLAPPPFPVITSQPIPVCHTHTRTRMIAVELGTLPPARVMDSHVEAYSLQSTVTMSLISAHITLLWT